MKKSELNIRTLITSTALLAVLGLVTGPALAQLKIGGFVAPTAGGLFASSPAVLIGKTGKALQEYCSKSGHLPKSTTEMDDALKALYTALFGSAATVEPVAEKQFRVLGGVMLGIDDTIGNIALDELKRNPPASFKVPEKRLVVLLTGDNQFVIWYSAADGKPAVDALGQAIILRQECSK